MRKMKLHDRVKATRLRSRMTLAEVARAAGITPQGYGNIERGHSMPRVDTLARVCVALGVRLDTLLSRVDFS